ncbi:hypothetical protein GCM10011328_04670 [Hafnia psychrotolerans]|uniref:Uncharacterized protein n=1 Tax=Hafnia psychrotolerans TaxID=1477018 RepID=A0ABQ1FWV6_9GAMM|nr:hypothetical protein GCM10011328_04670 [Hafnia psychrotolerans]
MSEINLLLTFFVELMVLITWRVPAEFMVLIALVVSAEFMALINFNALSKKKAEPKLCLIS